MRLMRWGTLAMAMLVLAACSGDDDNGSGPPPEGEREWTVMVYMAADNSLAADGIFDIDEMEAAGVDPKVKVVVQAEFSPEVLSQYGCTADCFNRPNFNTFRYALAGEGAAHTGPNGPATDIGNVDMTNPATLTSFVNWAKATYPAKKYLLVLWNHGGGYTGLIQDETSAGSDLMSLDEMRAGLTGTGGVDVIDFDMCLMAGYETMLKLTGLTSYAVFSEEVVPGEGNPYTAIINAVQADPAMDGRDMSTTLVDRFHAAYQGNQASTTKSAYDMAGLTAFDAALDDLADAMVASLPELGPTISASARASQKYTISQLTDIVNFLDTLKAHTQDEVGLQQHITTVRTLATANSFRIASRARTGTGQSSQGGVADVSRSTGLHIVLPSGGNDVFTQTGRQSLAAYGILFPGTRWTSFLQAYAGGQTTTQITDQGENRFESYLVWDPDAIDADVDLDYWVLEPNGTVYVPAFGSVTPNGTMTNDSYNDRVNFEGYVTNRFVQNGDYFIFANLYADPHGFVPTFDLAFRDGPGQAFRWLWESTGTPRPTLSMEDSWLEDPTPTLEEILAGEYTDLRYIATLSFGPAPGMRATAPTATMIRRAAARITPAQLVTLKQLSEEQQETRTRRAEAALGRWPFAGGSK